MGGYKSEWSKLGLSNIVASDHPCLASGKVSYTPRYPVLVSGDHVATFAMCTIPKVGCTNFRKLLSVMLAQPEAVSKDAFTQFFHAHISNYPAVWHFDIPSRCEDDEEEPDATTAGAQYKTASKHDFRDLLGSQSPHIPSPDDQTAEPYDAVGSNALPDCSVERLPEWIPSFVVGRSPYVRLVSGYLDKMVADPERHDQWTVNMTNKAMGLPEETTWDDSPQSFRKFVQHLSKTGVHVQNEHFSLASTLCSASFRFDYYLRLEEMPQWFPCWMEGLGLRRFTESGWADSPHGRIHVGAGSHFVTHDIMAALSPETTEDALDEPLLEAMLQQLLPPGANATATVVQLLAMMQHNETMAQLVGQPEDQPDEGPVAPATATTSAPTTSLPEPAPLRKPSPRTATGARHPEPSVSNVFSPDSIPIRISDPTPLPAKDATPLQDTEPLPQLSALPSAFPESEMPAADSVPGGVPSFASTTPDGEADAVEEPAAVGGSRQWKLIANRGSMDPAQGRKLLLGAQVAHSSTGRSVHAHAPGMQRRLQDQDLTNEIAYQDDDGPGVEAMPGMGVRGGAMGEGVATEPLVTGVADSSKPLFRVSGGVDGGAVVGDDGGAGLVPGDPGVSTGGGGDAGGGATEPSTAMPGMEVEGGGEVPGGLARVDWGWQENNLAVPSHTSGAPASGSGTAVTPGGDDSAAAPPGDSWADGGEGGSAFKLPGTAPVDATPGEPSLATPDSTVRESIVDTVGGSRGDEGAPGSSGTPRGASSPARCPPGAASGGKVDLSSDATLGEWVRGELCWWSPRGVPCDQFFSSFTLENGTVVPGDADLASKRGPAAGADQHDTQADEKWKRLYDQETADMVYFLYYADFKAFGYERYVVATAAPQGGRQVLLRDRSVHKTT